MIAAASKNALTKTNQSGPPNGARTMAHMTAETADMVHPKMAAKQMGLDGGVADDPSPPSFEAGAPKSR
jgi:hypothetical protein